MEIVRYVVTYCEDDQTETEKGWAYGEKVSDAVTQIMEWYGEDNVDTITIRRLEARNHAVLPEWEEDEIIHAEQNV